MVLDDFSRPVLRVALSPGVISASSTSIRPRSDDLAATMRATSHCPFALGAASWLRHRTIVAAAADYFFDRHWKAAVWSFGLGAIPMERTKVNRSKT